MRWASPEVSIGETVRHSSSRTPAATNWPSSRGPPSVRSLVRPCSASAATARAGSTAAPVPAISTWTAGGLGGAYPVGRCGGSGEDQGGGERGAEEGQVEIECEARADHGDGRGGGLPGGGAAAGEGLSGPGGAVPLLAYRLGADDHGVGQAAQGAEDPHVGAAGDGLGAALVLGRAVEGADHVGAQPGAVGLGVGVGVGEFRQGPLTVGHVVVHGEQASHDVQFRTVVRRVAGARRGGVPCAPLSW